MTELYECEYEDSSCNSAKRRVQIKLFFVNFTIMQLQNDFVIKKFQLSD